MWYYKQNKGEKENSEAAQVMKNREVCFGPGVTTKLSWAVPQRVVFLYSCAVSTGDGDTLHYN